MKSVGIALCVLAATAFGQGRGPVGRGGPMAPGMPNAPNAAPVRAPVTGNGAIEGQVVSAATGTPLKKTSVRLFGMGDRDNPNPTRAVKETDEQGRFVFTNLPPGKYNLQAERQGYLQQGYGARRLSGNSTPIPLGQDQQIKDLVFKLSPASVIVGKVLDEDGDPVANVNVQAMRYAYRAGKKQWVNAGGGSTSDIGEYRIPNLQPGRYLVSANGGNRSGAMMALNGVMAGPNEPLPDKPEMVYTNTYYPNATDTTTAAPVDIVPGAEARGIDIRLMKTKVFRVRGRVTNAPAAGPNGGRVGPPVMVMLAAKDGPPGPRHTSAVRPPDNTFEIRGVSPGSYIVFAQFGNGSQQQMVAAQSVDVTAGHVEGLMLTLAPGAEIQGSVKVVDSAAPVDLPNININLRPMVPAMGGPPRAKMGEDHRFTLKNVPPMPMAVAVSGVPENCYIKSMQYGGREIAQNESVEMTAGGTLDITLSATAGTVDAVVMNKDGQPVQGAMAVLVSKDTTQNFVRANSTQDGGAVSFKGLKPGEYMLFAWEDVEQGAYQDPDFRKPFESRAETVKIDAGGQQKVQVKAVPADEMGR